MRRFRLPCCGHYRHTRTDDGQSTCLDCGQRWVEHSINIPDEDYDTLLGYMARKLDSK